MATLIYEIEFFTFWQTGSGLSGGASANAMVRKNKNDLPFIPGKTLKGLLKEAADKINKLDDSLVTTEFIEKIFGVMESEPGTGAGAKAGSSFFGNAELSNHITLHLNKESSQKSFLYSMVASTAIDRNGQALTGSLRQMEVTIPLTLYGYISDFPDNQDYLNQLERCFQWIKKLGANRSRGMGRCQFSRHKLI